MDAINVVLVALATWQIVEILHHSELALPANKWANKNTQAGVLRSFLARAFRCPFCLSHWVAGVLVIGICLSQSNVPHCRYLEYVIWLFAAVRLANLGNDLAYGQTRSPKFEDQDDDIEIDDRGHDSFSE